MNEDNAVGSLGEAFVIPGGEVVTQPDPECRIVPSRGYQQGTPLDEARWRVALAPVGNAEAAVVLELRGDIVIGTGDEAETGVDVSLEEWQGASYGISTRHVMLRPTRSKIYIMDLRSSAGTAINGLPLGVGWAYALQNNDTITLGQLNVRFRVIQQP
jgi:hypothetical protein